MLKERFGLGFGSEIHLKQGEQLTPGALDYLSTRKIRVLYLDSQGNISEKNNKGYKKYHPLSIKESKGKSSCPMGSQTKPESLTLLNDTDLVVKNHPRIKFRGEIDDLIAQVILTQGQFVRAKKLKQIRLWLQDIRSQLGQIMQAEVQEKPLNEMGMGDFSFADIRKMSHNPLKYLGHNHIVPTVDYGPYVGWLNALRTKVRKVELLAVETFEGNDLHQNIILTLNRMSSAIYVLMILTLMIEKGDCSFIKDND